MQELELELEVFGAICSQLAEIRQACEGLVNMARTEEVTDEKISDHISRIAETAIRETIRDENIFDELNAKGVCF